MPDGDLLLVLASNWGSDRHPAWSANLLAAKQVTVRRREEPFAAWIRMLTGVERDEAWSQALDVWPNYQIAQEMAGDLAAGCSGAKKERIRLWAGHGDPARAPAR